MRASDLDVPAHVCIYESIHDFKCQMAILGLSSLVFCYIHPSICLQQSIEHCITVIIWPSVTRTSFRQIDKYKTVV